MLSQMLRIFGQKLSWPLLSYQLCLLWANGSFLWSHLGQLTDGSGAQHLLPLYSAAAARVARCRVPPPPLLPPSCGSAVLHQWRTGRRRVHWHMPAFRRIRDQKYGVWNLKFCAQICLHYARHFPHVCYSNICLWIVFAKGSWLQRPLWTHFIFCLPRLSEISDGSICVNLSPIEDFHFKCVQWKYNHGMGNGIEGSIIMYMSWVICTYVIHIWWYRFSSSVLNPFMLGWICALVVNMAILQLCALVRFYSHF